MSKQLYLSFFLALAVAVFGSVFFPFTRLFAFAPFLALVLIRSDFLTALWLSAGAGLIIDLLSSQMQFGAYSLIYCLTALLCFHQKRHFFADKPLALTLYTALISFVAGSLELTFLYALDARLPLSLRVILIDLIGMSALDAAYAFLCFTCPMKVHAYLKRIGGLRHIFFRKEEEV
jgi:rod shape-determining protein MreD